MKRFNTNAARLFLKGLVTAWVPFAIAMDAITWDPMAVSLLMGASTFTVDGFFWMFGVGEGAPAVPAVKT
jgi:hypothetical protein